MKRLLASFIAGVILASASVAGATGYLRLHKHQAVFYGRVACVGESNGTFVCLKNRQGYSVGYSHDHVYVMRGEHFVWHR